MSTEAFHLSGLAVLSLFLTASTLAADQAEAPNKEPAILIQVPGVQRVLVSDLDRDGNLDLIVTARRSRASLLSVYWNAFVDGTEIEVTQTEIEAVAPLCLWSRGDDRQVGVVVSRGEKRAGEVGFAPRLGERRLGEYESIAKGFLPLDAAPGDLDGNGHDDLVVAGLSRSRVSILWARAQRAEVRRDYETHYNPWLVCAEDLDGDERADLLVSANGGSAVHWHDKNRELDSVSWLGAGWTVAYPLRSPESRRAQISKTGYGELEVLNWNDDAATFESTTVEAHGEVVLVDSGDTDGDAVDEMLLFQYPEKVCRDGVCTDDGEGRWVLLRRKEDGDDWTEQELTFPWLPQDLRLVDVNLDGREDLVGVGIEQEAVLVIRS